MSRKADPTETQRLDRIGKKISALLEEAMRPHAGRRLALFFEPESRAVFVMDRDHPGYVNACEVGGGKRQGAVLARIPVVVSCPFDAGGW